MKKKKRLDPAVGATIAAILFFVGLIIARYIFQKSMNVISFFSVAIVIWVLYYMFERTTK